VTQPVRRDRRADGARAHRVDVRRRIVAAVLGVVAIVLLVLALRGPGEPEAGASSPRLATPLWSVRRVPQSVVGVVG
jgi:hypothetical protein